jgi:hypothetical protein
VVTCLVGSELAMVPLLIVRGASQAGVVQASLVGTILHLFVCMIIATILVLGKLLAGAPYLFWLLGLYGVSLMALVFAFVKTIRSAPPAGATRH